MQSVDNPISKRYPIFQEKNILRSVLHEYVSQQYKDPLQEVKTFLGELKNKISASIENIEQQIQQNPQQHFVGKIDLLNYYEKISQKGQFITLVNDYMSDSTNSGIDLAQFLHELNKNQLQNSKLLKIKLENFQKTQVFIKQQQSFQQRFQDITTSIIEIIGKLLTFENMNDCFYQQVESNLEVVNSQLEVLKSLFLPSKQIKEEKLQKKETIFNFIQENQKDFSYELFKLTKSILHQETRLNKNCQGNPNQQLQIQESLKQFNQNLQYMVSMYSFDISNKFHISNNLVFDFNKSTQFIPITPNVYQIMNMVPNSTLIKCFNQENFCEIYHQQSLNTNQFYKVQLEFKPFQNQESQYTFCVGFKEQNQLQKQNPQQQVQQYFFSNSAVEGRLKSIAKQGIHIRDQKISHNGQMRKLEITFCLQKRQFTLMDFPKRENIIIAEDQRLEKMDLNQKYLFFIKTQRIQEINLIEFTQNPSI
ncbi:hypothetical protein ABPG72_009205 [Tetrahymena utriculariae]